VLFFYSFFFSVKLDGCILGKNTQVGTKAVLSRCVTQAGYEVSAGGKSQRIKMCIHRWLSLYTTEILKGEKLEISNWMATPDGTDETETD
jgi:translation initiation factor eIF-2B subunit gamma